MSARILLVVFYIGSLMGSGAVISLLLAAVILHWFGNDAFGPLIGAAIEVGAAVCILSIGFRLAISTWLWAKNKLVHSNG